MSGCGSLGGTLAPSARRGCGSLDGPSHPRGRPLVLSSFISISCEAFPPLFWGITVPASFLDGVSGFDPYRAILDPSVARHVSGAFIVSSGILFVE